MGKLRQALVDLGCSLNGHDPMGETITQIVKSIGDDLTGETIESKRLVSILQEIAYKYDYDAHQPSGKINITSTAEVDVAAYATAQVVDANLVATNIKKDVVILGITGTYEGEPESEVE